MHRRGPLIGNRAGQVVEVVVAQDLTAKRAVGLTYEGVVDGLAGVDPIHSRPGGHDERGDGARTQTRCRPSLPLSDVCSCKRAGRVSPGRAVAARTMDSKGMPPTLHQFEVHEDIVAASGDEVAAQSYCDGQFESV